MMARDGPQGDFMDMAKQASMGTFFSDEGSGGAAERREDNREKRANAEGKACAFCGLRYVLRSTSKYGNLGSSPKKKAQGNSKQNISSGKNTSNEGRGGNGNGNNTNEGKD